MEENKTELENQLWKRIQDENTKCDNEIYNNLVWRNNRVYLSSENQFNFKAIYDLAIRNDKVLPATFKLMDNYYEFTNVADLEEFYLACIRHIQGCLAKCWQAKEAINAEYAGLLKDALV